ncbi:MAG: cell division protein ZapB [Desulfovibrio sp.]|jgi:cell division protein ZapB|uniref:cell division protein ZapB n=1 Tax=uncultured Desulfovibrio sp. TaxID=167968 RepID=UPI001B158411|nr:cell division protein ZapB [uncultured Desulfovibrio sp.]MBE6441424.1 cell division protein ZapB [Desulfovibrio desulfuricans]MBO5490782.1 cell division protein ZapB [Desulfovibrio sp.]MBO6170858.1 cell division protein ZapB [Desulfovibrio sp.]
MELLEQLESRVESLLTGLGRLRAENARISAEAAAVAAEKASLEEENRRLRETLENEETLRAEARKRIDALLRKIQEHDSVE